MEPPSSNFQNILTRPLPELWQNFSQFYFFNKIEKIAITITKITITSSNFQNILTRPIPELWQNLSQFYFFNKIEKIARGLSCDFYMGKKKKFAIVTKLDTRQDMVNGTSDFNFEVYISFLAPVRGKKVKKDNNCPFNFEAPSGATELKLSEYLN